MGGGADRRGVDPDFHRRDLYDAIENGAFPEWELGIQVFPDTQDETFEGIDLLDPTKIVPEELAPVQAVGPVLNGNPTNFFAETEQVAFHTGHLVPGIEGIDDPLLQGRNFSYLDTQLTRLGGPNFAQIPVNRPLAPVNDNNRDGFMQQAVHAGQAPYTPNKHPRRRPVPGELGRGGLRERAAARRVDHLVHPGRAAGRCSAPAPAGARTPSGRGDGPRGSISAPTRRIGWASSRNGRPRTVAVPEVGRVRPRMQRIVVVLPEPFGPRKPVTRPGSTVTVRSSTATRARYAFVSPSSSITAPAWPSRAATAGEARLGPRDEGNDQFADPATGSSG